MIIGKQLTELDYRPSKWFKGAVEFANQNNLEDEALASYLKTVAPTIIEPLNEPLFYSKNIKAETEDEFSNLQQVFNTMEVLMKTPTLVNGALMPDAYTTGDLGQIPVGGVVLAKNAIHNADIYCSVMMTIMGNIIPKDVLDKAQSSTHFGGGGRPEFSELPSDLEQKISKTNF